MEAQDTEAVDMEPEAFITSGGVPLVLEIIKIAPWKIRHTTRALYCALGPRLVPAACSDHCTSPVVVPVCWAPFYRALSLATVPVRWPPPVVRPTGPPGPTSCRGPGLLQVPSAAPFNLARLWSPMVGEGGRYQPQSGRTVRICHDAIFIILID